MKSKVLLVLLAFLLISSACKLFREESRREPERRKRSENGIIARTDFATSVTFNGNRLYYTEKDGRFFSVVNGRKNLITEIDVPQISGYDETGLLGVAFLDDRPEEAYLYHTYSRQDKLFNRVITFNIETEELTVILDGIDGNEIHNGGKLAFGPDGMLYITTGDAGNKESAQDTSSLNGKILRIRPDGSIPADNPFNNAVWSFGHRNVFGLDFDDNGRLFITENGPEGDDEINRIVKGSNYGWPTVTGNRDGRFELPVKTFQKTTAPTGIVTGNVAGLEDKLLVASYTREVIYSLNKDGSGQEVLSSNQGKITDLTTSPSQELYICSEKHIRKANF